MYRVRGYYKPILGPTLSAGCGGDSLRERPRLVVELAAPLALTPSWHLASRARVVRIAPMSTAAPDHCDVTILRRDLTPRVVEAARGALPAPLRGIDRRGGGAARRRRIERRGGVVGPPDPFAEGGGRVRAP